MLSGNAFNLWGFLYGINLSLRENIIFFGLEAKTWGRIIFFLASLFFTGLLFWKRRVFVFKDYLQLGVAYTFSAFLFLTNMHERYLYPTLVLLTVLLFLRKNNLRLIFFFVLLSFIYLLNLYHLWWFPRMEFLVNFLKWENGLVPRALSFSNILVFLLILREFWYEKKLA